MENAGAWFVLGLMVLIALTGTTAVWIKIIFPAQIRARRASSVKSYEETDTTAHRISLRKPARLRVGGMRLVRPHSLVGVRLRAA
jgi:hypothetical protein